MKNLKFFQLLIIVVLIVSLNNIFLISKPLKDKSNNIQTLLIDCNTIEIYTHITSDCCVEIETTWGSHSTEVMTIEFEQLNSSGNYVSVETKVGIPAKHKYCPNPGENFVSYRIKWYNSQNKPACAWDENWLDDVNRYARTVDLSCCGCPTDINNWLTVKSKKDNLCLSNGCKYEYTLTIPESYNCFTNYKFDNGQTTSITSKNISGSACMPANSTKALKFVLLKANGDSCVISKDVSCAAKRDSNSLPEPCLPDCLNDTFRIIGPTPVLMSGCLVYVTYATRKSCEPIGYQDIQIIKMDLSPNCLLNLSMAQIYKAVIFRLIRDNVMGFEPKTNGCSTVWRIIQSGCWQKYTLYSMRPDPNSMTANGSFILDSTVVYEPCKGTECCLQTMTVCRSGANNNIITITYNNPNMSSFINCQNTWLEDPQNAYIYPCEPKCEWLYSLPGSSSANLENDLPPAPLTNISNNNLIEVGVNVVIIDKLFSLMIKNQKSSNAEIIVTDIKGNTLNKSNIKLHNNDNYYNINLNEFNNGVYIYSISIDGIILKTDKFIINK